MKTYGQSLAFFALAYLWAPTPASADTLYACKLNGLGTVRMVSATTNCSQYETKISWNSTGPQGAQGVPGLTGPAGATGPAGPVGPAGTNGAAGPVGATGAMGVQGLKGDTGPQGPPGIGSVVGSAEPPGSNCTYGGVKYVSSSGTAYVCNGANGANGAGLPVCTPDVAVLYNGAFTCKSELPHFADNGDGTVTDNQTGLMWEKKSAAGTGDVHDVNNTYTWTTTGALADGTLFTSFIPGLNGGDYTSQPGGQIVSGGVGSCFANHCDWRIPTLAELNSIIDYTVVGCNTNSSSPCIGTAFGPTQAFFYWPSSAVPAVSNIAWSVNFINGIVSINNKTELFYARAVRTGR